MIDWFTGDWTDKDLRDRIDILPRFRSLIIEGAGLTDEGAELIASECGQLRELHLINTSLTDAGLKHIGGMTSLDWLAIDGARVTDEGISSLSNLRNLVGLQLIDAEFSDDGLSVLLNFPQLGYLETAAQTMGGKALSTISSCPSLNFLRLASPAICDADFINLTFARSLNSLSFDCPLVSSEAVAEVMERLPGCVIYPFEFYSRNKNYLFLPFYCLDLYEREEFALARNIANQVTRRFPMDPAIHATRALINLQLNNSFDFTVDLTLAHEMAQLRKDHELMRLVCRWLELKSTQSVKQLVAEEKPEELIRKRFNRLAIPQSESIVSRFHKMCAQARSAPSKQRPALILPPNSNFSSSYSNQGLPVIITARDTAQVRAETESAFRRNRQVIEDLIRKRKLKDLPWSW